MTLATILDIVSKANVRRDHDMGPEENWTHDTWLWFYAACEASNMEKAYRR